MANEIRDNEALARLLENLDIQLSQSSDGVYTVCTTSEPLFCYDSDSREELEDLVWDTLVSYAKHFHQVNLPRGDTKSAPIEEGPLPVEVTTPLAWVKPVFDLAA